MKAPKILTIAAVGILLASVSFAGQRSRGGGAAAPRGPRAGGSPPVGRAVPRGPMNPAPGRAGYPRPGYPGGAYYGYGHHYSGYPYYYGYPGYSYGYPGFSFSLGFGFGYPYGYAYPYPYRYGYSPWPYPYGYAPWYGYPGYVAVAPGAGYGGVRIAVDQRDAEVLVDGHYMGVVDNFDGTFQQVNLEPGPHRVEVRRDGFEPVTVDVNIQPGRTVTYRVPLRPAP
jgi:hypothetical protein